MIRKFKYKPKPLRSKYNNVEEVVDGIKFKSKKEASYYQNLKLLKQSGKLLFFLRQVPFHLPGGVKYVCDFMEFHKDGSVVVTDVKGFKTDMYKTKQKLVEGCFPIEINEA